MSGLEVAGLVIGIVGLVAVIKEANLQVKKLQQRRRIRTLGFSGGDTTSLAKELQSSQLALTSRYNGFYDSYGRPFAQGDDIAIRQLSELLQQFQEGLTQALRNAQQAGKLSNPYGLVRITITGRTDAVSALADLSQRVAIAMPIKSLPSSYGTRERARRSTRLSSYSHRRPSVNLLKPSYEPKPFQLPPSLLDTIYKPPQSLQFNIEPVDTSVSSLTDAVGGTRVSNRRERKAHAKRTSGYSCGVCNRKFCDSGAFNQHNKSDGHKAKMGY